MKINKSRKSTVSVMANAGFGDVAITRNGVTITIPTNWMFTTGQIKKCYMQRINNMFAETADKEKELS